MTPISRTYVYDPANWITNHIRTDSSYVNYRYDPIGQLKSAVGYESGGTLRLHENLGYAYDAANNLSTSGDFTFTPLGAAAADATPPMVAIASPAPGTIVSGVVTVSATASDNVAVAGVQFLLDGAALGAEVAASPYSTSWNAGSATSGAHSLSARARDAAGNQATSAAVSVTVKAAAGATTVTLSPTQDTYLDLTANANGSSGDLRTYTWPANQVTPVQEVIDCQQQLDTVAEPAAEEEIHQEITVEGEGVLVVLERASLVPDLELSGAYPRVIEGEGNRGAKARVLQELLADELRHRPCFGHPRVHEAASGGHAKSGMQSPVRLEFSASAQEDLPPALGDSRRITQCLLNLAGNALKFTAHGRVDLRVERQGDSRLAGDAKRHREKTEHGAQLVACNCTLSPHRPTPAVGPHGAGPARPAQSHRAWLTRQS